ncbi:MAG: asparagine synthase (glutamine-hydrolyzing) [Gammaproteobacteria bacterium]|nr:asparagine synthase (glutamine-hydrolyzing) [Gammaproteobacteria bacterium]
MCGIVGSLNWQTPDSESLIQRMATTLAHRGPDAEKVKKLGPMVFGHRRLSIIDVSPESDQPMCDTTGRYWIVYNGELYNFKTLKAQLKTLGHTFKTESDTEVVLEAWKHYGIGCLEKLVGMFAFALWDKEEQSLILVRDRMGEKPLYYTIQASRSETWEPASTHWRHASSSQQLYNLVFASELSALSQHPCVAFKVSPKALSQFLSLNYVLTDACILEGIEKLPPAHYLLLKKGQKPQIQCYWHLHRHFKQKISHSNKADASSQLESMLNDIVRDQMISDVPLGAFLSGGIDSSTIVAAMKHAQSNPIKTFSIGFHEKSYNEIEASQIVAKHLSVDHHTQFVDVDMVKMLPSIIQRTDEPLADSSIIPTYFLAEFSRKNVKVCLSGDGGDELFSGYDTYTADKLHRYFHYLPKSFFRATSHLVEKFWPVSHNKVSLDYKLKQFLKGCQMDFQRAHYFWRVIFSDQEKAALLTADNREAILNHDPYTSFAKAFAEVEECHPLDQASYVDMKTWMVDDILVKVDRLSMAHSLEVRAPFLNHHLVEFAAKLPIDWKMKFFQKKHILKLSQATNLPHQILHRSKKGFNAPISSWFSGKLETLARESTLDNIYLKQWFNRSTLEQLWQEHRFHVKDHGLKLFSLLCLGLWFEHYQELFKKRTQFL